MLLDSDRYTFISLLHYFTIFSVLLRRRPSFSPSSLHLQSPRSCPLHFLLLHLSLSLESLLLTASISFTNLSS
jgi:hypothetical protein